MSNKFSLYQKITVTEIRPYVVGEDVSGVNIADYYLSNGSPKKGDMICRNRSNPKDVWLVDKKYFSKHYAKI